ncbi:aryl-sulfate sulfotransferase [Campylobacter jejuni]
MQPVDKNVNEWFSPVTSLTQYEPDKDSIMVYSATA